MATLTSKGQITIPKSVRDGLHLQAGDRVEFVVESDGTVRLVPVTSSVTDLKGIVPPPRGRLSLADMDEAVARGASKR